MNDEIALTIAQLAPLLAREGFDTRNFSLEGGEKDDAMCIDKIGSTWIVYYSERGEKSGLKRFPSEPDAIAYFLSVMRGPGGPKYRTNLANPS